MTIKELVIKCIFITLSVLGFVNTNSLTADSTVGEIEFKNCKVSDITGKLQVKAECATLSVPENYAAAESKNIELHIARFKARNDKERVHATTLLAGGPGQGAIATFAPHIRNLRKLNTNQDIYLIDQRGTGQSNQLQCSFEEDEEQTEFDPELAKQFTERCLNELPGDPRYYTSSVAIQDLDIIRQKLGLEQWNLYGGSYGTRTAQHYLKMHPENVRTVILDAVVSADMALGPAIALESQRALDEMLARCAEDVACNDAFPNLSREVSELINELKQEPKNTKIENLASGKLEEFKFTAGHLALGVRMALYSPMSMSILPSLLHEAASNSHYGPLARQSINAGRSMYNMMAIGMSNSVMCTEDEPYFKNANISNGDLEASYMGSEFMQGLEIVCEIWPKGVIDPGFKELIKTDLPVLLLSGDKDPITPPEYAEQAMQKMSNSKHIVVEGQGHIQMAVGCMPTILAKFVEAASFTEIETDCLHKVKPEPFFIDFNGPTP